MVITKIKQIGKTNCYHLYIDESFSGVFLDEILAIYHLKTNQEIDEEQFKQIKKENDEKLAFEKAISYLERYSVSEKGLKDYLKKKGFDNFVISQTMIKLHDYQMIDDEKFAVEYFNSFASRLGKNSIANKLRQKGISKEIVDNILISVDDEDQLDKALLLAKKFVKNRENSAKTFQKCLAHLIYKGYDYSVAQQASKTALSQLGEAL